MDRPVPSVSRRGLPDGSAASGAYPDAVEHLIARLARLPGIGRRSAERLAFHILTAPRDEALALAQAIDRVKSSVTHCRICFNFADHELCSICQDPRRQAELVLVVERPRDVIALEQTGLYRGVYHVLLGHISPLDGVGPDAITVAQLLDRVDHPERNSRGTRVAEVILGLNPTLEGDGTALYVAEQLRGRNVRVSRLARGLPTGGQLEFATKAVLADALQGRQAMD